MKKLGAILLLVGIGMVSALTLLMNYQGNWESTTTYRVTPIKGTNANATPVVISESNVYVATNESRPILGTKPASQPIAWKKIN